MGRMGTSAHTSLRPSFKMKVKYTPRCMRHTSPNRHAPPVLTAYPLPKPTGMQLQSESAGPKSFLYVWEKKMRRMDPSAHTHGTH